MKQVIYFGAEWCGPCRSIKPRLQESLREEKLSIRYVDVDQSPQMASDYLVKSIPTVVLVENGEVTKRVVGTAITPDVVKEMLK